MKKIIVIFILTIIFAQSVFAQSSSVRTKVGTPSENSSDNIKVAEDIKSAYDNCAAGSTYENSSLGPCLREKLSALGYSESTLSAFESRRSSGLADGCTQCVGYIGLILTVLSGSTSTLQVGSAADVVNMQSISAGAITFNRISDSEPLQPGDIGAHGGGFGHILMVNQVEGNVKFTALESNGNFDCRVTDNRQINRDGYVFFRKM